MKHTLAELRRGLEAELRAVDRDLSRLLASLRGGADMRRAVDTQGGRLSRRATKAPLPDRAARDERKRRILINTAALALSGEINRSRDDTRAMLDAEMLTGLTLEQAKRRVRARVAEGNA